MTTAANQPRTELESILMLFSPTSDLMPQTVKIGGDVAAVLLGDAHLRHHGVSFHLVRMLNPVHQIFGRVGQFAGYDVAVPDGVKRRANHAAGARHSWNGVARLAAVLTDGLPPRVGITSRQGH